MNEEMDDVKFVAEAPKYSCYRDKDAGFFMIMNEETEMFLRDADGNVVKFLQYEDCEKEIARLNSGSGSSDKENK